ncbi:hypothetical protein QFZ94_008473 [Paraburkholderia sp. JPY465]
MFAVVKRLWGFTKVRYRGLAKNANRAFVALALTNVYLSRRRLMAQVRPQWAKSGPQARAQRPGGQEMQPESFTHDESASVCARIDEYNGLFSVALVAPQRLTLTTFLGCWGWQPVNGSYQVHYFTDVIPTAMLRGIMLPENRRRTKPVNAPIGTTSKRKVVYL